MKKTMICILALLLLFTCTAQAESITYTGKIVGGKLHMRSSADANGKIIKSYAPGTKVTVLENDGTWCKVKVDGQEGYMKTKYLNIKADYPHLGWAVTPDDGAILNLWSKPEEDGAPLRQYRSGIAVETVEKSGSFTKVRIGNELGYLPSALLTPLEGQFEPGLSFAANAGALTLESISNGKRMLGSSKTRARQSGDFPYSITYPLLNIPEADEIISRFIQDTLARFEEDAKAHHAGEEARYDVTYLAEQADERYAGIVLMGQYTAGTTCLHTITTLNIDLDKQSLVDLADCFPNPLRLRYGLKAQLGKLLPKATDGYTDWPEMSILDHAVLTRQGLEFYLAAGLYAPPAMGSVKLTIPYYLIAENMNIDSAFIKSHKREIDPTKPMIALTFDDGPSGETDRILNVLAQYDARATFCVMGKNVEPFSKTVNKAIALGNEIASHTWSHPKLTEQSAKTIRSQLERTNEVVRQVADNYQIKVLRAPYGSYNKNVRSICADLDMIIASWEIDTKDWATRSEAKTYNAIIKGAKESGVIILCHDLYETTASAVERAVPELVAQGIQLVTVSELLSFHKDGIVPGKAYSHISPENIRVD